MRIMTSELRDHESGTEGASRAHAGALPSTSPHQDVMLDLPTGSVERKELPVTTGVFDYFPEAIAYLAKISKRGNDKHNPGEPLHWARGKSDDQADCIGRHLIERGTVDPDDGLRHSGKLAWRALALLQTELEKAAGWSARGPVDGRVLARARGVVDLREKGG